MTTFNLVYTIEEASSWRGKESIKIKSNLADDKLIECEIAQSLVEYLRKESAVLEPDKFLLSVAEAQKRNLQTLLEDMDNISFTFHISGLGYATLNVISTNRQAISYYGRIETIEED